MDALAERKSIAAAAGLEKPVGITAYFDRLRCHLIEPADNVELGWLEKQCGRGGLRVDDGPARFDSRYRQRLQLYQPTPKAIVWLARRDNDAYVNGGEFALDLDFDRLAARDDTYDYFHRHLCRRWHGSKQEVRLYRNADEQTRYHAAGTAPNRLVVYPEEHSRHTGELQPILHVEWRATSGAAMRSAGIASAADLVRFSHREFWARRLLLCDVDVERLGRLVRNHSEGTRSKSPTKQDRRGGLTILQAHATIQQFLDDYAAPVRIRHALIELPNDAWLPPEDEPSLFLVINDTKWPTCSHNKSNNKSDNNNSPTYPEPPPALPWIRFPKRDERCADWATAVLNSGWDFRGKYTASYDPIEIQHFLQWIEGKNPRRGNFERDMSPAQIELFEDVLTDYRTAVNAARAAARAFVRRNRRARRNRWRHFR
jgi:hypothetical protein